MSELRSLIELLGEEATLKIVEAYGGTRLSVPKVMPKEHRLRELLGDGSFALLYQYFGGSTIMIPIAREWRIDLYLKQKPRLTRAEIARRAGCSENTVYAHQRGDKRAPGQLNLTFEG